MTTVSLERATRLYRMLTLLGRGAQTRAALVRRLRLGIRGYYRDLEILRAVGILVEFSGGKYRLKDEPTSSSRLKPVMRHICSFASVMNPSGSTVMRPSTEDSISPRR